MIKFISYAIGILTSLIIVSVLSAGIRMPMPFDFEPIPLAFGAARFTKYKISTLDSGSFTTSSTSYVDATNVTVTMISTGRPVMIGHIPGDGLCHFTIASSSAGPPVLQVKLIRDVTDLGSFNSGGDTTTDVEPFTPCSAISFLDTAASAGSHTWKTQVRGSAGTFVVGVQEARIYVYELP